MLGRGSRTQISLPAEELTSGLAVVRTIFTGTRMVKFGHGNRTFMIAAPNDIGEFMLGPAPKTAFIETVELNATPPEAYGPSSVIALALPLAAPPSSRRSSGRAWVTITRACRS